MKVELGYWFMHCLKNRLDPDGMGGMLAFDRSCRRQVGFPQLPMLNSINLSLLLAHLTRCILPHTHGLPVWSVAPGTQLTESNVLAPARYVTFQTKRFGLETYSKSVR